MLSSLPDDTRVLAAGGRPDATLGLISTEGPSSICGRLRGGCPMKLCSALARVDGGASGRRVGAGRLRLGADGAGIRGAGTAAV